ncbi:MAG: T9SS type A sorting domain-containing protein [Calditrichaeota bacterium]|nr:T9SS type A sorting domain-containing protein [Calditrichota bacterium]
MKTISSFLIIIFYCSTIFAQQTIFFDGFEDGLNFNSTYWEPIVGVNNGVIQIEEQTPWEGFNRVRIGKTVDAGGVNVNELRLHLDLSQYADKTVMMTFAMADYYDETNSQDAIYFSDDGGNTFEKVYQLLPSNWTDGLWGMLPPIDISLLAKQKDLQLNNQFVISFRQQGEGDFNTSFAEDGFFIDAVHIYDPQIVYSSIPFFEGFEEDAQIDSMWTWSNASIPAPGTCDPSMIDIHGVVQIYESSNTPDGLKALRMTRTNDGNPTVNALDLHLNLINKQNVDLEFFISEYFESNNPEDAIYFSNNGGKTFVKAYQFLPEGWSDNPWGKLPPLDVDRIANDLNLAFSDSFVIRFQQRGLGDLNTSFDEDGLFFDAIKVFDPQIHYVDEFPFIENFESGKLDSMWHIGNANYPSETAPLETVRPHGVIGVSTNNPYEGFYSAFMGRRYDGELTSNALDLHLKLQNAQTAILNFQILDFYDETQDFDGIYYSNDGGSSFTKIFQLDPSSWADNTYRNIVLNIKQLANNEGLSLTDSSIIRFQQYGDGDFNTSFQEDGFRIDNVTINAVIVGIDDETQNNVEAFTLHQNYPNPFNPTTTIEYALPKAEKVHLTVFNMLGQEVATLVNGEAMQAGVHSATFKAENLPSGVYYYRITAGSFSETKKMLLVR